MRLAWRRLACSLAIWPVSSCTMSPDQQYVEQQIPISIEARKPAVVNIASLSGNGWNEVGVRCSPGVWDELSVNENTISIRLVSSSKSGTKIINVSPNSHKLWPVESFHYLFSIGGEPGSKAAVELTFLSAKPGTMHVQVIVLKTPADTGL